MLKLINIKKTFENPVLDAFNLILNKGDLITVCGGTGSGKTTLINILSGLILPDEGDILLGNESVLKNPLLLLKRSVSVSGRKTRFFQRLSVADNLRFFASFYDISDIEFFRSCYHYMNMLGLNENILAREFISLSSGMVKAVDILFAALCRAEFTFIDEPVKGLDKDTVIRLSLLTDDIKARQGAAVFTSSSETSDKILTEKVISLADGNLHNAKK